MTTTVLLAMDLQAGIVAGYDDAVVERAGAAIAAARARGIPVVYVRVAFRPGHPEIAGTNRIFGAARDAGRLVEGDPASAIDPAVAPRDGDIVVVKRRVSAFAGSDLAVVLRGLGATDLVLCGVSTSGVVLSTLREAADLDFGLTVLADACADRDPEVHRVLTGKVFRSQAEVLDVAVWAARA